MCTKLSLPTLFFQVCSWDTFLQECCDVDLCTFGDPQSVPMYEFAANGVILPLSTSDREGEPRLMHSLPSGFYTPFENQFDKSHVRLEFTH